MAQICPKCGRQISPLIRRNNGIEQVCPFCWDVVSVEIDQEVTDMRSEFGYIGNSDGLTEEFEARVGICTNCRHQSTCTFPGCADKPKLFCEEFECLGASCAEAESGLGILNTKPAAMVKEQDAGETDASKYLGLCVNCDNRESCNHPKPAGGVWYCEEYR